MIIFGVRSPLAAEYEETCRRLSRTITACISIEGVPRVLDQSRVFDVVDFDFAAAEAPFLPCAFSPSRRRELTALGLQQNLLLSEALVDPTAILAHSVRVGDGSFINAGVVVGAVSMIGQCVLVNRAVSLGHHTILGDYVSVGPGVTLAGNIRVGAGTVIGVGAVVLPDIRIGERAVIAGGSVVREHVPDGAFVAGSPATIRPYNPEKSSLNIAGGE